MVNCIGQNKYDSEITPPGFQVYRKDRDSEGGGAATLFLESVRVVRLPDIDGLECVVIKSIFEELHIVIGAFYRPSSCETLVEIFNESLSPTAIIPVIFSLPIILIFLP